MGFALKTRQKLAIVRELKMHDFDRVDAIVFGVTGNIDSGKAAPPKLINEFVTSLDDTAYHVTTHYVLLFKGYSSRLLYIIQPGMSLSRAFTLTSSLQ